MGHRRQMMVHFGEFALTFGHALSQLRAMRNISQDEERYLDLQAHSSIHRVLN